MFTKFSDAMCRPQGLMGEIENDPFYRRISGIFRLKSVNMNYMYGWAGKITVRSSQANVILLNARCLASRGIYKIYNAGY